MPTKVSDDTAFPFKVGQPCLVEIESGKKGLCVKPVSASEAKRLGWTRLHPGSRGPGQRPWTGDTRRKFCREKSESRRLVDPGWLLLTTSVRRLFIEAYAFVEGSFSELAWLTLPERSEFH